MAIIDKPTDYFETLTWSGNSTDNRAISGLDFAPNWVWIKCRNNGQNHNLFDTVRGATESIESNSSNAENTDATSLKSFTSDGYTLGTGVTVNGNSKTYVGWNWKAGTSFTNDASSTGIGTIDSAGSVNQDARFSIVSYTGNSPNATTIKHGLNSIPQMIIFKRLVGAGNFTVYHQSLGNTKGMFLTTTAAADTSAGYFNNTTPTSSVFSVANSGDTNSNGNAMIAYCFAEKTGYSKFGSYTGNGNSDGPFVYTGFKPAWVMIKKSSASGTSWEIRDNKRQPFSDGNAKRLFADDSSAESSNTEAIEKLSNGFKIRSTGGGHNTSGATYIYMAFAENPFVASNFNAATAQ